MYLRYWFEATVLRSTAWHAAVILMYDKGSICNQQHLTGSVLMFCRADRSQWSQIVLCVCVYVACGCEGKKEERGLAVNTRKSGRSNWNLERLNVVERNKEGKRSKCFLRGWNSYFVCRQLWSGSKTAMPLQTACNWLFRWTATQGGGEICAFSRELDEMCTLLGY